MRRLIPAACLLTLFWSVPVQAASVEGDPFAKDDAFAAVSELEMEEDPLELGGFIEFRNQLAMKNMEESVSLRQRLRLEGKWEKDALSFFGNLDADQELAATTWEGEGHQVHRIRVREAYAMYDSDHVDLFVGRKIQRWGTGDGINPMDLINPMDVLDPISTGRADNRQPVPMVGGMVTLGDWNLEGIFLPKAGVSDLPRSGNPWEPRTLRLIRRQASQGLVTLNKSDKPDDWFSHCEYGGRVLTTMDGWDLAALAFHGYVNSPVLEPGNTGGGPELTPTYPEFTAYGLTFAKGLESNTLRGELAWKPDHPYQDGQTGLPVRNDLVQAVLGWDYDLDGKYYFNVQGFIDTYGADTPRPDWRHGMAYEISGKWADDSLSLGIRGKLHTDGEGSLTELFADYALTDDWKLLAGIMVWNGPKDGLLGQYGDNDYTYITVRYSF